MVDSFQRIFTKLAVSFDFWFFTLASESLFAVRGFYLLKLGIC